MLAFKGICGAMEDRDDYEEDLHTPRQGTQAQSDHQVIPKCWIWHPTVSTI